MPTLPSILCSVRRSCTSVHGRWKCLKVGGSKQWPGPWRARGARAYNGGLGAEPPAGSRGRAFWFLNIPRSGKTYPVVSW